MPSAHALLDLYRVRLNMADEGVTHLPERVVATMRAFVARLARLDPNESIVVVSGEASRLFSIEATNEVIADFQFDEKTPEEIAQRRQWFDTYCRQLDDSVMRSPEPGLRFACPCCRELTLDERGGFEICPVCFWEDDGQDDHDAQVVRGGPNGRLSLEAARANYVVFGACDARTRRLVRGATPRERGRDD